MKAKVKKKWAAWGLILVMVLTMLPVNAMPVYAAADSGSAGYSDSEWIIESADVPDGTVPAENAEETLGSSANGTIEDAPEVAEADEIADADEVAEAAGPRMLLGVSGSQVAADGEYTVPFTVEKYKDRKYDKSYYGYLTVYVSDGKIAGLYAYGSKEDKFSKVITNDVYWSYVGKEASVAAIEGVDGVSSASVVDNSAADAISSATSANSDEKYYVANVKAAVISALESAPQVSGCSSADSLIEGKKLWIRQNRNVVERY